MPLKSVTVVKKRWRIGCFLMTRSVTFSRSGTEQGAQVNPWGTYPHCRAIHETGHGTLFQQGVLEYLSAFDEEAAQVCSLDPPGPLPLPLVEEEEAVSEPEACEDSEVADDSLGEGTVCTELNQEEPITKPGFPQLSSSPCYYFYQGESLRRRTGLPQRNLKGVAGLAL